MSYFQKWILMLLSPLLIACTLLALVTFRYAISFLARRVCLRQVRKERTKRVVVRMNGADFSAVDNLVHRSCGCDTRRGLHVAGALLASITISGFAFFLTMRLLLEQDISLLEMDSLFEDKDKNLIGLCVATVTGLIAGLCIHAWSTNGRRKKVLFDAPVDFDRVKEDDEDDSDKTIAGEDCVPGTVGQDISDMRQTMQRLTVDFQKSFAELPSSIDAADAPPQPEPEPNTEPEPEGPPAPLKVISTVSPLFDRVIPGANEEPVQVLADPVFMQDLDTDDDEWTSQSCLRCWRADSCVRVALYLCIDRLVQFDQKAYQKALYRVWTLILVFLMVGYVFLVSTALEPMSCTQDINKKWYMIAHPQQQCNWCENSDNWLDDVPYPILAGASMFIASFYGAGIAIGETVILLIPRFIPIETPTQGREGCSKMTISMARRAYRFSFFTSCTRITTAPTG